LAEAAEGKRLPRAIVPRIQLESPKLAHRFTTERFAQAVAERQRRCMARAG
jgi:hypothetical protein